MNERKNQAPKVLEDKRFDWRGKKVRTFALARLLGLAGYQEYANRSASCATWLQYNVSASGDRQLCAANFCQLRLCPMCTARRAKKAAYKLSQVMNMVQRDHEGVSYLFLTLTVKNCEGAELGKTLSLLTQSWDRLCKQRPVMRAVSGWFRAIEITRRDKGYHPHIHAILAVEPPYFARKAGLYITHGEWVSRWQTALRAPYKPSVRVSRAKGKEKDGGEMADEVAVALEAAKYATKDSDYIDPALSDEEAVQIVTDYTRALYKRRLTAYGGWLKEAAAALDAENLEEGDLVHVDDEYIREDVAELIEEYRWNFGAGDYILADRRINPLKVVREPEKQDG